MFSNKLKIVLLLACLGLGLLACGDTEEERAMDEDAAMMAVEAYDPDVPPMIVEDNGVIGEEEI